MTDEQPSNSTTPGDEAEGTGDLPPARGSVGSLLRSQRNKSGKDISSVSQTLRISQRYLQAIEDGRNSDLPGTPYAVGFVRSYAEYLGLDADEMVRLYKQEASELPKNSELSFPKPIPEGGIPGGAVLAGGVALALIAYGILYYSSSDETPVTAASVEAVPERMADNGQPGEAATGQGETAGTDASPDAGPATDGAGSDENVESANQVSDEASGQASAEPAESVEPAEQQPVAAGETASPDANEAGPVTQPVAEEPAAQEQAEEAPSPPPAEDTAAVEQIETPVAQAAQGAQNETASEQHASRITVRARTNSWIQIRDEAEDKLMFTRLLRKGDEYAVPDQKNLVLLTGNAGALEIIVDGKAVPAIGKTGDVLRDVQLDPEKLKSGNAVGN